jgi:hypothetical protein
LNYRVTITNADGTAEHYELPQHDAYALVLAELASPTLGTLSVHIIPGGAA